MNKALIAVLVVAVVACAAGAIFFMNNGGDHGDGPSSSVSIDANGGYGSANPTVRDGKFYLPTKDSFTRPGYTLAGWSTDKNTDPDYEYLPSPGSVQTNTDKTWYAIWHQDDYDSAFKYNFSAELADYAEWTETTLGVTTTKKVGSGNGGENGKVIKAKIVIKNTGSTSKYIGSGLQGYEYYAVTSNDEVCREYAYNGSQYIDSTPSNYNKSMGGTTTIAGGLPNSIDAGKTITLYKFFVIPVNSTATSDKIISVTFATLDKSISV